MDGGGDDHQQMEDLVRGSHDVKPAGRNGFWDARLWQADGQVSYRCVNPAWRSCSAAWWRCEIESHRVEKSPQHQDTTFAQIVQYP